MEALATSITRRVVVPNIADAQALGLDTEKAVESLHKLVQEIELFLGNIGSDVCQIYYFLWQLRCGRT